MLRYFLKIDPEFGTKMVQASLAARKVTGCYRMLLQDLGSSLPKVEPIAIGTLDDSDLEVANDAALALGRWGTAKAEALKQFLVPPKGETACSLSVFYRTRVSRAA
jgi:hypothetical protein